VKRIRKEKLGIESNETFDWVSGKTVFVILTGKLQLMQTPGNKYNSKVEWRLV
jgi:hypothetical protein